MRQAVVEQVTREVIREEKRRILDQLPYRSRFQASVSFGLIIEIVILLLPLFREIFAAVAKRLGEDSTYISKDIESKVNESVIYHIDFASLDRELFERFGDHPS